MSLTPGDIELFESALTPAILDLAWRYSYRLSKTREDAEDLLQDALAHALTRIRQLRDLTRFRSWLMSIVRTRFLMQRRRNTAEDFVIHDREQDLSQRLADHSLDTESDILVETTRYALQRLADEQREILSLFYIDGLSLIETGEVLSISQSAVRSRLFRARGALRRELSQLSPAGLIGLLQEGL
ncbi:sigma-70 family RNA polymerase sigma factor [bacterium]|nr:sigma-70 family RNA polymerase sigma factor [bacterium]